MFTISVTDLWLHRRAGSATDPSRPNWRAVRCCCGWFGPYRCREEELVFDIAFHRSDENSTGPGPLWGKQGWVAQAIGKRR